MIELKAPLAVAVVRWLPESQGGRHSGPPTAPVYAATTAFGNASTCAQSGAELLSILVQRIDTLPDGSDLANIGFLVPDLARAHLRIGTEILITEGPNVVARAVIRELLQPEHPT
ncbi:hypothetical protein AB9Q10_46170 [Streptomyces krungchingensis]|uniref:hypothetical protein n=1 Tax=Streptomyces krungchingensis TaxID=1565034 RepID=UPI003CE6DF46